MITKQVKSKLREVNLILDAVAIEVQTAIEHARNLLNEDDLHDLQELSLHASSKAGTIESGLAEYGRIGGVSKKFKVKK